LFEGGPGGGNELRLGLQIRNACPENSTDSGGECSCNSGYFERPGGTGTICVKPDDRTPEQFCEDWAAIYNSTLTGSRFARAPGILSAWADGAMTCMEPDEINGMPEGTGCKHWFTGDISFKDDNDQWVTNGYSVALNKGDPRAGGSLSCSAGEAPPEKKPEDNCKHGYPGTVNGVDVCIEAWTGDTEGRDRNRITDGEGNVTDITTEIKCKGDQCEVKETRTTKKPDGTTTTTTDTTPNVSRQGYCARNPESSICGRDDDESGRGKGPGARGGGGGKGDGDGEGEGFCKENPDLPICKESSFGGSCQANFTCDGDAIQCSIAREQHIRNCKLFDDPSDESRLYEAEKAKDRNRDVTASLPGNEVIDVASKISYDDVLGGGACISDLNIQVMRQSITLPISTICPQLGYLGYILVAVASLAAARIVSGTSKE